MSMGRTRFLNPCGCLRAVSLLRARNVRPIKKAASRKGSRFYVTFGCYPCIANATALVLLRFMMSFQK